MGSFYFEQLLNTALQGIDGYQITRAVLGVAGTILLLSFLWSAYQAFSSGGDVRMLAVSGIGYLVLGLVFADYGNIFRGVNSMFNSVADFIYSQVGVGDLFSNWLGQLSGYIGQNSWSTFWKLVTGSVSGVLSMIPLLAAFIILPISYTIFTLAYAMYGSILYVTGPFVLALLPARGFGQLARTYLINLMTFMAWGLIYAIIQALMSAINMGSLNQVLQAQGVLNGFIGVSQMMLLAIVSILFALSIAIIPFIASRIVRGDVGSTLLVMVGTAVTAAKLLAKTAGPDDNG